MSELSSIWFTVETENGVAQYISFVAKTVFMKSGVRREREVEIRKVWPEGEVWCHSLGSMVVVGFLAGERYGEVVDCGNFKCVVEVDFCCISTQFRWMVQLSERNSE